MESEKKLGALDREAIQNGLDSGTFGQDKQPGRAETLQELAGKIERYRTIHSRYTYQDIGYLSLTEDLERFILDHMDLKSRPRATAFQLKNVEQWLKNANNPIIDEEVACFNEEYDIIPVVSKRKAPVRQLIGNWAPWFFRERRVRQ